MYSIRELAEKCNAAGEYNGKVLCDEPLAGRTTMRVGGKAALFLEPADEKSLLFALGELRSTGVPFFVLGGGSNVIISDSGFDGAVISTRKMCGVEFSTERTEYEFQEKNTSASECSPCAPTLCGKRNTMGAEEFPVEKAESTKIGGICGRIAVAAGTSWGSVMAFCREHDLGGLEGFTALSGTVGGAVYMNATCFGLSACDRLVSVRYLDTASGEIGEYVMDEEKRAADWGYKKSPFQAGHIDCLENSQVWSEGETSPLVIILSAQFSVAKRFDFAKSEHCIAQRKEKGHFLAPSAGSVFKNDAANGVIAGKLIDECGLKGFQIGGAKVAPWHGNFIVNTGNATAQDIFDLVQKVRNVVREKKGIFLETEIIFCGNEFSH